MFTPDTLYRLFAVNDLLRNLRLTPATLLTPLFV
jgi:hypothetical protein